MIKSFITMNGTPKVVFRGDTNIIKGDLKRILLSMIQKDEKTRTAVVEAVTEVNEIFANNKQVKEN